MAKLIFPNLPELEQREIRAKIEHLMKRDNQFYYRIMALINDADENGKLSNVKFLNSIIYSNDQSKVHK
jgi:hypothetical protein